MVFTRTTRRVPFHSTGPNPPTSTRAAYVAVAASSFFSSRTSAVRVYVARLPGAAFTSDVAAERSAGRLSSRVVIVRVSPVPQAFR